MASSHLRRTHTFAIATLVGLCSGMAAAASPSWQAHGPFCTVVTGFSAGEAGTAAYLAAFGRVFRSEDGVGRWARIGADQLPLEAYLADVSVSPFDPDLAYAALFDHGVFRSEDGGQTWVDVSAGLPDRYSDGIATTTSGPDTVFATHGYSGIFRSRNRGATWVDIAPVPDATDNFFGPSVHPTMPNLLWITTSARGLWRSTDEGNSWSLANDGLPQNPFGFPGDGLGTVALDPSDPSTAFVARYHTLYRFGGQSWQLVGQIPLSSFAQVNSLLVVPGSSRVLLAGNTPASYLPAGVMRSEDDGVSWTPSGLEDETVLRLEWLAGRSWVVAETLGGAFYSSDKGITWNRIGSGVAAARILSVAAGAGDGAGPSVAAGSADCPSPVDASTTGGWTWKRGAAGPGSREFLAVAFAPGDRRRIIASSVDGFVLSEDGGATWKGVPIVDSTSGGRIADVSIDPSNPRIALAADLARGLLASADGGHSWTVRDLGPQPVDALDVEFLPGLAGRILLLTRYGLRTSEDGGTSWSGATDIGRLQMLATTPAVPGMVLAASQYANGPVLRSLDGGRTWIPGADDVPLLTDLALDPVVPGRCAATTGEQLLLSHDSGNTWMTMEDAPLRPTAVAFSHDGRLFVGTGQDGVYSLAPRDFPATCTRDATTACLLGGAFEVRGTMTDFGTPPRTVPIALMAFATERAESNQAVFFDSFSPGNFEVGVKMVDGCGLPAGNPLRAYWVFMSGLTNAETEIVVHDTVTGQRYRWENPAGTLPTALADTAALSCVDGTPLVPCIASDHTACLLGGRFEVTGSMQDFATPPNTFATGVMTVPEGRGETDQGAFFESFTPGNFELGVKMVDACGLPTGHPLRAYWAFYSGLTNAAASVEVTHLASGATHRWSNRAGNLPVTVGDTAAFPCDLDGTANP